MNRLKNLLQYDAGKFIHVGILVLFYILSKTSYLAIGCFIIEFIIILKQSKSLIIYALIFIILITFRIYSIDKTDISNNALIEGTIIRVEEKRFLLRSDFNYLCYYDDIDSLSPGMTVQIKGKTLDYETYQIMNTFDYDLYLRSEKIKAVISINKLNIKESHFIIQKIPYMISKYIEKNYTEENQIFLKLFVLGIQENNNNILLKDDIRQIGISHLFAISGLHLGLVIGLLNFLIKKLYISKQFNQSIILGFIILYNIITGFKITILRASFLVIGLSLVKIYRILLTRTDLITFSFLGFTVFNPYIIYNLGFELSYLIVLVLILSSYLFKDTNKILSIIRTTILATLFSLPLTSSINHEIGLVFIYANIFFIIYVTYIFLPMTFLILFLPFLEPFYSVLTNIFIKAVIFFNEINKTIYFTFPNNLYRFLFWFLLILILIYYKNLKKRLIITISLILICISSYIFPFGGINFVRFFDIGQGDGVHIHDGICNLIIDTGDIDDYNHIIQYFKNYNITKIDIIVISHWHSDHYGELEDLAKEFNIDKIYVNHNFDIDLDYIVINKGQTFNCGKAKFQVISANHNDINENNNSLVIYGIIGGNSYLFTGDIEKEIEEELVEKYQFKLDVLKVAHHGSNTSSITSFINMTQPKIAIISVGKNNIYNFPGNEALNRLTQGVEKIYRTDRDGTITIYYTNIFQIRIIEIYRHICRRKYILSWL